jgi:ribulose-bisphosphate carboxylase large chain
LDVAQDGISQLLCMLMGGQLDIDIFLQCHLLGLHTPPEFTKYFKGPKYGISGVREFTNVYDKPVLGGIIKPKTGISADTLLEMVKELVEGGINFIKEDEIMSNPASCPITERVPKIMEYVGGRDVIYAVCINSDPPYLLDRVQQVHELGGNAVHVNFWSGLGAYKSIRDLDLDMFLFFQKSGDKILTNDRHAFHINWSVVCELAGLMGVDFIHAGMWGGYSDDGEEKLVRVLRILRDLNVVPSLSCGMHPGLVQAVSKRFGVDYLANVGGAIHGHPEGTLAGVKAMRQAIDGSHGEEYWQAIEKWGLVE